MCGPVRAVGPRWAAYELSVHHLFVPRVKVWVACWRCKHTRELDVVDLAKYGRHTLLSKIEARLKCSHCGMVPWSDIRVEWQL